MRLGRRWLDPTTTRAILVTIYDYAEYHMLYSQRVTAFNGEQMLPPDPIKENLDKHILTDVKCSLSA